MSDTVKKIYETVVKNRECLTLSGVINVEGFAEDYLTLKTELGDVVVEGHGLKIESLTKENGEIFIIGRIDGVYYKDQKSEKGFWGKIFK